MVVYTQAAYQDPLTARLRFRRDTFLTETNLYGGTAEATTNQNP
jgi:hypothetical protein